MNDQNSPSGYGLSDVVASRSVAAPALDYLPPRPVRYRPRIGLIGAGGITEYHLRAYRQLGLEVAVICDLQRERARQRRDQFYPAARITDDYQQLLADPSLEVVDIATHPQERVAIVRDALLAGKHVLSQKPFVLDLQAGRELVQLAEREGRKLAVNQNGRWAPHFSYLTQAIEQGLVGQVASVDFTLQWDHTWTAGLPFEEIHHLLLYDFAIHWFDIACAFLHPRPPRRVYASVARTSFQRMKPPFLAQAVIDFDQAQVRIGMNAHVQLGQEDRTVVAGSHGTLRAFGPGLNDQQVMLWTEQGHARPALQGNWFENGFQGAMGELLCAIEQNRTPRHNARENLRSLQLCFAAVQSADRGEPIELEDPAAEENG